LQPFNTNENTGLIAGKSTPVRWTYSIDPVDYPQAELLMRQQVERVRSSKAENPEHELIWGAEHPPLFTRGTSAKDHDLLDDMGFPVYQVGRGGQFTYHGPGQLVVYVMIDIAKRKIDIRSYIQTLELWVIKTLETFDVKAETKAGRVGIWIDKKPHGKEQPNFIAEEKIAAIGVRVTKGVTWHGVSVNINPNLNHFKGIVPCGIRQYGVTSLFKETGIHTSIRGFFNRMITICPF